MFKTHFTRKNIIFISIFFFLCLCLLIGGLSIDPSIGFLKKGNPIQSLAENLFMVEKNGFKPGFAGWTLTLCFIIYLLLFAVSLVYELRLAKYYDKKYFTKKWVLVYIITFIVSFGLCFGIGMVAQYPYDPEYMKASFIFLAATLVTGLLIFIVLGAIIFAICSIYVNFRHIDEPFRFFGAKTKEEDEKAKEEEEALKKELEEQGNLAQSFGEGNSNDAYGSLYGTGGGSGSGEGDATLSDAPLKDKERVFPGLCSIDLAFEGTNLENFEDNVTLNELCTKFRNYLAHEEKLYFSIDTIRAFIAGLAASRLIILEGLSGTGKSSLARYFSEFIGESSYFEAVQATWRDRTSLLGYYNDFSKTYNETEFLKRLYEATYKENDINIMVLDEINISRVEYYFADFLSVLEYPTDKWILKIMQLPFDFDAPSHLENGKIKISKNTWFIGTANKDDSTYTITDKVYDRAITINFDNRNEEFVVEEETPKVLISYNKLTELFNEAINKEDNKLSKNDLEKFKKLTDFTYDTFDLTFGNRIMHQIEILTPVYVECGGSKEEALDFMFSRKVVGKLQGRFEDYIKQGLIDLRSLIEKTYGKEAFKLTKHEIFKLLRKL